MIRDEIIKMAQEAGWTGPEDNLVYVAMLERFAALVAADERAEVERLRSLCDEMLRELYAYRASEYLKDVTAAIQARGNT